MAQEKVAETVPLAKPQREAAASKPLPRLTVVVSDPASKPGVACKSSLDVFGVVGGELSQEDREIFIVLHLDGKKRLLARETIAIGSQSAAIVHPREVFKGGVLNGSAAIVCAHNHPSGDPSPSQEDREITARLKEAGELMGIELCDHVIIGKPAGNFYSFVDSGTMATTATTHKTPEYASRSALLNIGDRLAHVHDKTRLLCCMNLGEVAESDDATHGYELIVRSVTDEIKGIGEEIMGIIKGSREEE